MSTTMTALLAATAILASTPAFGQGAATDPGAAQQAQAATAAGDFADAEVRRVDKDGKKVTLRHGPIPNLGMGNMTMVFRVTEPVWLDGLKPGDKVRFKADKVDGQYTVTAIEPAR